MSSAASTAISSTWSAASRSPSSSSAATCASAALRRWPRRVLNLITADRDRSIAHINPNLDLPNLAELIIECMDTVAPLERDVRDRQGHWFALRIRPYKNLDNKIDGAVLALFDIDILKRSEQSARARRSLRRRVARCHDTTHRDCRSPIAAAAGERVVRSPARRRPGRPRRPDPGRGQGPVGAGGVAIRGGPHDARANVADGHSSGRHAAAIVLGRRACGAVAGIS